jgi:phosphoenolpyruvate carboxylase
MHIPRTMSTQHPDNVRQPFFANSSLLSGDDEIKEAFYAFSHLKIREQLWDYEGKDVDNYVVEKLFTRYEDWFKSNKLGKDFFVTLRGPNPRVEKNQGKVLIETLESIPRNYDVARHFYEEDIAPIFEISIPMTSSAGEILRVKEYYRNYIVGKKDRIVHDVKVSEWVGEFKPEEIRVIPLLEDKEGILSSASIVEEYLKKAKEKEYQRVWLARSDPALNYGSLSAVMLNKIAFQRLDELEKKSSIDILPIIGCGSVPFRGNLRPDNYEKCMKSYPSVQTFTLQSAYKYDYPENVVRQSVEEIEATKRKKPSEIDEVMALEIIEKISEEYQRQVAQIAPLVNQFATFIPARRSRKLHIGLFGYSRQNENVTLPRAIKFCAALYSLGIPPELLGLNALSEKDMDFVRDTSKGFDSDMEDALRFLNKDNLKILPEKMQADIMKTIKGFKYETDRAHKKITSIILDEFRNNKPTLAEDIQRAASIRKFLG